MARCEAYAAKNGFSNLDYLLEQMIYPEDAFNALVIIDELEEELESFVRNVTIPADRNGEKLILHLRRRGLESIIMNTYPLVRQGRSGGCSGRNATHNGGSRWKRGFWAGSMRRMGRVIGCGVILAGWLGGGKVHADVFLDLTSVTPGGPGLGAFSGTLGGIAVTGSVAGSPSVFSINAPGPGISNSTTDGSSLQYGYSTVYSPTIGAADRIGYNYLGGATNTVILAFASPVTNPVIHVANLDVTQFSFAGLGGLTSMTLLNGNGGAGDGIAVVGGPSFSILDLNTATSDATLPTGSPPIAGARSAYGSVQLNGTFTTIGIGVGASGPGADIGGGSFTMSVVPETGSMILVGLGALGMLGVTRRRAQRSQATA